MTYEEQLKELKDLMVKKDDIETLLEEGGSIETRFQVSRIGYSTVSLSSDIGYFLETLLTKVDDEIKALMGYDKEGPQEPESGSTEIEYEYWHLGLPLPKEVPENVVYIWSKKASGGE